MREDLLNRDPLWESIPDCEDMLTVHLYRQCALRIAAVVQILRELNLDITDDEIRRHLKPALVMDREVHLRSPREEDLPLLDIFNRLWLRSRHNLVGDRGPDVLFSLTTGRESRLTEAVVDVVDVHVHGPTDSGNSNQMDGDDPHESAVTDGGHPVNDSSAAVHSEAHGIIPEVSTRAEEELDYEADDSAAGNGDHERRDGGDPDNREQSGEESDDSSSSGSSSSDNDDAEGDDNRQPSLNRPSYATVAISSPVQRKITVSKQPLYENRASAASSHGFV